MSGRMKTHHTEEREQMSIAVIAGIRYELPHDVLAKYRVDTDGLASNVSINAEDAFADLDARYTKAGCLLQGIRYRDGLTQVQMAEALGVTQSDISQMETGKRKIGRTIAKRIQKKFGTHYRSFLE